MANCNSCLHEHLLVRVLYVVRMIHRPFSILSKVKFTRKKSFVYGPQPKVAAILSLLVSLFRRTITLVMTCERWVVSSSNKETNSYAMTTHVNLSCVSVNDIKDNLLRLKNLEDGRHPLSFFIVTLPLTSPPLRLTFSCLLRIQRF